MDTPDRPLRGTLMQAFLRTLPLPSDEWLPSYLTRLSRLNHCSSLRTAESLCRQHLRAKGISDSLERPTHIYTYDVISTISRMPSEQIYAATVHRFTHTLQHPSK